jgi:hypothetical protein
LANSWDGKDTSALQAFFELESVQADFMARLLSVLGESDLQPVSSWLLKHALSKGFTLSRAQQSQVLDCFAGAQHWQAQLHFLQVLPSIPISEKQALIVREFLLLGLQSDNKFVRAWSYGGFLLLAHQHEIYHEEAESFCAMAERDESAAVKARIRQQRKSLAR